MNISRIICKELLKTTADRANPKVVEEKPNYYYDNKVFYIEGHEVVAHYEWPIGDDGDDEGENPLSIEHLSSVFIDGVDSKKNYPNREMSEVASEAIESGFCVEDIRDLFGMILVDVEAKIDNVPVLLCVEVELQDLVKHSVERVIKNGNFTVAY